MLCPALSRLFLWGCSRGRIPGLVCCAPGRVPVSPGSHRWAALLSPACPNAPVQELQHPDPPKGCTALFFAPFEVKNR